MAETHKIAIDDIVESAASGVLRALEARAAGKPAATSDLVKSGFNVNILIRCGGYPGPIEILGEQQQGGLRQ
jgi:hypothetical protein